MPQSFTYKDVGTNIDCGVGAIDNGRFRMSVTIEDTSVIGDEVTAQGFVKGSPAFRSFRITESMVLKDGQSAQFTSATDKVTGEVVKADVTLNVIK